MLRRDRKLPGRRNSSSSADKLPKGESEGKQEETEAEIKDDQ